MYTYTMINATLRFHGHGSLRYLYKNGSAVRSHLFTLKYTVNPHRNKSRFAVVVSKKVHKSAVGRNRIRRRVYEILRQEIPHFTTTCDVAVIISSGEVISIEHQELVAVLKDLLTQAELLEK